MPLLLEAPTAKTGASAVGSTNSYRLVRLLLVLPTATGSVRTSGVGRSNNSWLGREVLDGPTPASLAPGLTPRPRAGGVRSMTSIGITRSGTHRSER